MSALTLDVVVAQALIAATDVRQLDLVSVDGGALPAFTAGAHIDVHLPNGLLRQYSLCNDPRETHRYCIAVLREASSRGGSVAMHALRLGQRLRIGVPRNHFPLAQQASHHLLLAGGIGITPMLCMAQALATAGQSFALHYCSRSLDRTAFLGRLRQGSLKGRCHVHLDDGEQAQKLQLDSVLAASPADTHLYVCGPAGFIDWVLRSARAAGWGEQQLHREYFRVPDDALLHEADEFEVKIASTGRILTVAAGQTVLSVLQGCGISLPASCEQGICGSCVVRVLEGQPDHRDVFLTDEERASGACFTPCCSRARSARLTLDL